MTVYSCRYDHIRNKYDIVEGLVRCISAKRYEVCDEYDFGKLSFEDVIIDMYIKGLTEQPGVTQILK